MLLLLHLTLLQLILFPAPSNATPTNPVTPATSDVAPTAVGTTNPVALATSNVGAAQQVRRVNS